MTSAGSDGNVGEDCCVNDEAKCVRKDPDPSLRYVDHNVCNSTPVASGVKLASYSGANSKGKGQMGEDGAQVEEPRVGEVEEDEGVLEGVAAVVVLPNLFEDAFPRPFLLPIDKGLVCGLPQVGAGQVPKKQGERFLSVSCLVKIDETRPPAS
jgi:hypothetical protein